LQGTPYQLSTQGVLYTDLVAIGGETTGIAVESDQGFIELIVSRSMRESLANAGGKRIEVQGELILIQGVEIAQRRALIVESLNVLE
jgi:DNA/RNA endonuclease YhcR with UshA esterase domain